MLHNSNCQGICLTQCLVLRRFEIIPINDYPICKKQLYSHVSSAAADTGGKTRDYTCAAWTSSSSSSSLSSRSAHRPLRVMSEPLQSSPRKPLYVCSFSPLERNQMSKKNTQSGARTVCHKCTIHTAVSKDVETSRLWKVANSCRGHTSMDITSHQVVVPGVFFSVQASVLNWRLQRLKMRETQVNLSSSDHFNEA